MNKNSFILILLMLVPGGCATVKTGPLFDGVRRTGADKALLYMYRVDKTKTYNTSIKVRAKGVETTKFPPNTYHAFELAPGKYTVRASWYHSIPLLVNTRDLELWGGETYFLRLWAAQEGDYKMGEPMLLQHGSILEDKTEALLRLKSCKIVQ